MGRRERHPEKRPTSVTPRRQTPQLAVVVSVVFEASRHRLAKPRQATGATGSPLERSAGFRASGAIPPCFRPMMALRSRRLLGGDGLCLLYTSDAADDLLCV